LTNIGDTIGLNLFEPRYQLMCNRMASDPRFLFMPNYEDYRCAPGDVGFVVKLTSLWNQAHGNSYGVQGFAEQLVAVSCTWEEPNTNGLHYAQYWPLDHKKVPLHYKEVQALVNGLSQCDWSPDSDKTSKTHARRFHFGDSEVLCGCNWPDRAWILAFLNEEGERCLKDCWMAGLPELVKPRFSGASFLEQVVQRFAPLASGSPLHQVLEQLRSTICSDPDAILRLQQIIHKHLRASGGHMDHFMQADPLHMPKALWSRLLRPARLARVCRMPALMPSVRMEMDLVSFRPLKHVGGYAGAEKAKPSLGVLLTNDSNVELWAMPQDIEVTPPSARACLASLHWQLNRLRLEIVKRARARGQRPLAVLEDDITRLVFDFVASSPTLDC